MRAEGAGWRMLGSSAVIAGSLGLALAVYFGILAGAWIGSVSEWTARWTSSVLNLLGSSTSVNGTILSSDSFAVNIVAECTAVGPLVLFMGAVLAYPSAIRAKSIGWLLGLVVLSAVNLIRIMSLFWIGSAYPRYLDIAHLLVWQTAMILLAIVLWLFWVEKFAHARDR